MLRSLLTELLGHASQLAGAIVLLLAGIYVSGFLIVNLYLGQFGVIRLALVQARFIAAGVLFMFIAGIAGLFALFPLVLVSELLHWAGWLWENPQFEQYLAEQSQRADRTAAGTQDGRLPSFLKRALGWLLRLCSISFFKCAMVGIVLALAVAAFLILFTPFESISKYVPKPLSPFMSTFRQFCDVSLISSQVIAYLLSWTGGKAPLETDLRSLLEPLARLEGLSAFFVWAVYLYANRLHRFVLRGAVILAIILFLGTQAYSLIWFANSLYGQLPLSVGGGKPALVQFLAKRDELQALEELGVPIDPSIVGNTVGKTQVVQLIDQTTREASSATYTILPCPPLNTCRAVEFDSALVLGLIYCSLEQSP
jgi:hypothetical protein